MHFVQNNASDGEGGTEATSGGAASQVSVISETPIFSSFALFLGFQMGGSILHRLQLQHIEMSTSIVVILIVLLCVSLLHALPTHTFSSSTGEIYWSMEAKGCISEAIAVRGHQSLYPSQVLKKTCDASWNRRRDNSTGIAETLKSSAEEDATPDTLQHRCCRANLERRCSLKELAFFCRTFRTWGPIPNMSRVDMAKY